MSFHELFNYCRNDIIYLSGNHEKKRIIIKKIFSNFIKRIKNSGQSIYFINPNVTYLCNVSKKRDKSQFTFEELF